MRVLVTGRGTSGSWAIRGQQLGAAIGATVEREAAKCKGYDLAIVVKRAPADLLNRIRMAGVPVVWDVVDSWPQPVGSEWDAPTCRSWLAGQVKLMHPAAIVATTQAMAADCAWLGLPVLALPHHARPGQATNPIREQVQKVGYEGGTQYLGKWQAILERECAARGWAFVLNPARLADLDIVVALRDANGYAAKHWKSNVKLANAQASGTPIICKREAGYRETATGGELFADTPEELSAALDRLTDWETRKHAAAGLWPPKLERIAAEYRQWLSQLKS